jgi:hypothetical protein
MTTLVFFFLQMAEQSFLEIEEVQLHHHVLLPV